MPWCPKCKSEYRKGFTNCADCGSELVDEKPSDRQEPEPEVFVEELKIQESEITPEIEEAVRQVQASQMVARASSGAMYQDSSERASENRSSGWILMVIGALGILVMALGIAGVLPIRMGNQYLFYGVMGAIFILFFVAGVMSIQNAKIFEKKAESENSLRSTLADWCKENLTAEVVDGTVKRAGDTEEVLYFKRFAYIKERMNRQFVNLNQDFLDKFIDDFVYEQVFEKQEEA